MRLLRRWRESMRPCLRGLLKVIINSHAVAVPAGGVCWRRRGHPPARSGRALNRAQHSCVAELTTDSLHSMFI